MFAILAMKCKEISFTLPIVILLLDRYFFGRLWNLKRSIVYTFPVLLTLFIIPLSRPQADVFNPSEPGSFIIEDNSVLSGMDAKRLSSLPRRDYILTEFRVIVTYIRLFFFPINLIFDYNYPIYGALLNPNVFLPLLFLLSIFAAAIYIFIRSRKTENSYSLLVSFGIIWFFINLLIESGIVVLNYVIYEYRLYLPSIGIILLLTGLTGYIITRFKDISWHVSVMVIIIVMIFSIATYNRNWVYRDEVTIWEDVIEKAPNNSRAYNNLGVAFKKNGEFDKAMEQFEKSLRGDKSYTAVYFNLGDIQYRIGNYENAVAIFRQALTGRLSPRLHIDILNKLGRTYSAMGQTEKAVETFKEAIRLYPSAIALYNNLSVQYIKSGEYDLAIAILKKALQIREEPYLTSNLSVAYASKMEQDKNAEKTKKGKK